MITNLHNVTGWDRDRNQCLSATGAYPTQVVVPLILNSGRSDARGVYGQRQRFVIELYDKEGLATWLEHPKHGGLVDVIALQIAKYEESVLSTPVNLITYFEDLVPAVGDDVFVLGYPGGIDGGKELAIWKRGSIASQPTYDVDGLPKLLIDTATRTGMSGSPVIVRQRGLITPRGVNAPKGGLAKEQLIGEADMFLGVYSGRIGDDEMGLQLGVVWRSEVVDEIVVGGRRGRSPHF